MFTIKSSYDGKVVIKSALENVREFFSNTKNYVELMHGVESITRVSEGQNRWTIRVNFPVIGAIKQDFLVEKAADSDELIEWVPAKNEKQNFLKYAADFHPDTSDQTSIRLTQMVELRREKASQLHFLAGLAGEAAVSKGMDDHINLMLDEFLQKAKSILEKEK